MPPCSPGKTATFELCCRDWRQLALDNFCRRSALALCGEGARACRTGRLWFGCDPCSFTCWPLFEFSVISDVSFGADACCVSTRQSPSLRCAARASLSPPQRTRHSSSAFSVCYCRYSCPLRHHARSFRPKRVTPKAAAETLFAWARARVSISYDGSGSDDEGGEEGVYEKSLLSSSMSHPAPHADENGVPLKPRPRVSSRSFELGSPPDSAPPTPWAQLPRSASACPPMNGFFPW